MMTATKRLAAAVAALGLSTGMAVAAPAITETDLNMRAGPATEYGVVTVIPGGATVDVAGCSGGWCDVAWAGNAGFASASYLDVVGVGVVVAPPPAVVVRPRVVVRDRRYVRPGRVVNRAFRGVRRAIRRDARQDRRQWRRETRRDRRQWQRQDRRAERRDMRRGNRGQARRQMRQQRRETRGQRREARQGRFGG